MPMIVETSVQARFLIPMAISLGFGVLFATLITLLLVPAVYAILEDVVTAGRSLQRFIRGGDEPAGPVGGGPDGSAAMPTALAGK